MWPKRGEGIDVRAADLGEKLLWNLDTAYTPERKVNTNKIYHASIDKIPIVATMSHTPIIDGLAHSLKSASLSWVSNLLFVPLNKQVLNNIQIYIGLYIYS